LLAKPARGAKLAMKLTVALPPTPPGRGGSPPPTDPRVPGRKRLLSTGRHIAKCGHFQRAAKGSNAMQRSGPISRGIAIATLLCFASPQAEAIELFGAGAA